MTTDFSLDQIGRRLRGEGLTEQEQILAADDKVRVEWIVRQFGIFAEDIPECIHMAVHLQTASDGADIAKSIETAEQSCHLLYPVHLPLIHILRMENGGKRALNPTPGVARDATDSVFHTVDCRS